MNEAPRILAEIESYTGLQVALRARLEELNVSGESVDEVAGLPLRYTSKLMSPQQDRKVGWTSLFPLLTAMGMRLILVEDLEALAQYGRRMVKRDGRAVRSGAVHVLLSRKNLRKIGAKGGANSRKNLGKRKTKQLARQAAVIRWSKVKEAVMK